MRSLRFRVAASAAGVAAACSLASAVTAAILVDRFSLAAEDRRLEDAAALLMQEVDEPTDDAAEADDEAREIGPRGIDIALFEGERRLGGSPNTPWVDLDGVAGCTWIDPSERVRACVLGAPSKRVVAAAPSETHRQRRSSLLFVIALAGLVATVLAAFASRLTAGWALGPLTELALAVSRVSSLDPRRAALGPASKSAEVEMLRDKLRELLERLGTALELARNFGANAAHELRTPLATMTAELDLLMEDEPPAAMRPTIERVRRTVSRLSDLVDRLLMIADPTSGAPTHETLALEDVVRDVVTMRAQSDRDRIDVRVVGPGMIDGDEPLLRAVVENLVDNALKFAPKGRIVVRIEERQGVVELSVEDEGPGIAASDAERFLEPFARGSSDAPGHGLGLAIVAHAVRAHGGSLELVPRARGAEFRVRLPAWGVRTRPPGDAS